MNRAPKFIQTLRQAWRAVTGKAPDNPTPAAVIVHDPGAELPHDLDDPFLDPKVQTRMAEVITKSVTREQ